MDRSSVGIILILAVLCCSVLVMGCSSDSSSGSSAQAGVTTAATHSGALYSAGDIIKNPKSSSTSALLIVGYDPAADVYERAYIYPNSDGSWGYRMDTKTEKIARSTIEKVYTDKIDHKAVTSIPVSTPTPANTPTIVYTTKATTAATTSVTGTTTTSSVGLPKVISIDPDNAKAGTSVSITELKGVNFVSGATVALVKSGSTTVNATNVVFKSSNVLTCVFALPSSATVGTWDVMVTNPDGQYHQFKNGFTVREGTGTTGTKTTTTTATTTTSSTSGAAPTITSNDPTVEPTSGYYPVTIYGSNFRDGITARLTLGGRNDIVSSTCSRTDTTKMQCFFNIPMSSQGSWSLVVTNSDGTTATRSGALTVNG